MEDVIAEQSVSGYFVFCLQVSLRPRVVFFFFLIVFFYGITDLNLTDFIENNLGGFFPFYILSCSFDYTSYFDIYILIVWIYGSL